MLCNVCREGLQGIWDPSKTNRVCRVEEFLEDHTLKNSSFIIRNSDSENAEPSRAENWLDAEHYIFGHHRTQESFDQAIRDGCSMCIMFQPEVGQEMRYSSKISAFGYFSLFRVALHDSPVMHLYMPNSQGGFEFCPYLVDDENLNLSIGTSSADDTTWNLIQGWLNKCLQTHPRCSQRTSSTFLPTRLLQLESTTSADPTFRVIPGAQLKPSTTYMTLSHCYDVQDGELQLVKSNMAQLLVPQPVSTLPLSFQDAFVVLKRLGLTHLWIDRLCVIQDDQFDKDIEGAKKQSIFSNAYLSIAASGSTSSLSGLFSTRDPELVVPTVLNLPINADTMVPHIFTADIPGKWRIATEGDLLLQSAQAVQERLFAPRTVYFGSKMVFWECHCSSCAEIHPLSLREAQTVIDRARGRAGSEVAATRHGNIYRPDQPWKPLFDTTISHMPDDPIQQVFIHWFAILHTYSSCVPTVPEGKLLGIADVARETKHLLQERGLKETEYLAGIWKAMLPGALLWNTYGSRPRPPVYRSPSWSWAAVDGDISFHDQMLKDNEPFLCKLLSASTVPLTADETGIIKAGSIFLKGKLALARLGSSKSPLHFGSSETVLIKELMDSEGNTSLAQPPNPKNEYNKEWHVVFDTQNDISNEIMCLPVRSTMNMYIGCHIQGLALSRLDDGRYVRRGVWSILVETEKEEEALGIFEVLPEVEVEII